MSEVYKSILSAGAGLNLGHVGTRVINTLRMEKGFRGWVLGILVWVLGVLVWGTRVGTCGTGVGASLGASVINTLMMGFSGWLLVWVLVRDKGDQHTVDGERLSSANYIFKILYAYITQ